MPTGWPGGPTTPVSSLTSTGDEGQVLTVQADGSVAPAAAGGASVIPVFALSASTTISTTTGSPYNIILPAALRATATKLKVYMLLARGAGSYNTDVRLRETTLTSYTLIDTQTVTGSVASGFEQHNVTVEFTIPSVSSYPDNSFMLSLLAAASSTYIYTMLVTIE